ncbi:MAG: hypothetical protein ACOYYS_18040 [Chloroflexota bacterium]
MDTRIILSTTWVVVMLIYLLGDVLRIYSGDMAKAMAATNFPQYTWMVAAVLMLIPILMVFLTQVLPQPANRWLNILTAVFFILFNLVGLPGYPSLYDKFLLLVSMAFNGVTIGYAWRWA